MGTLFTVPPEHINSDLKEAVESPEDELLRWRLWGAKRVDCGGSGSTRVFDGLFDVRNQKDEGLEVKLVRNFEFLDM
ncbi:hypothetical protein Aduo_004654 [Ancylostoma duodenale]